MQTLKNISVGFLVSFLGSIPLGYLNIIGYQIYGASGMAALIAYLLGVVLIEAFVVYFTLIFADKLAHNEKLLKTISFFSILFLLLLAYVFYAQSSSGSETNADLNKYSGYAPFWIGIIGSGLNFIQIPFWIGWNLYLVNSNYISTAKNLKYIYVIGTLLGTFCGMLALALFLDYITGNTSFLSKHLMPHIIPLFFVGMALYQSIQFYRKYYR